jgi:CO dehydrogenase nickel-insertion accessory protein CooC1
MAPPSYEPPAAPPPVYQPPTVAELPPPPAPAPPAPEPAWQAPSGPASAIEPVQPPAPEPPAAPGDLFEVFDSAPDTSRSTGPRVRRRSIDLAPVIFSVAAKGGVGKTSLAMAAAHRAALHGNLRVVAIDANRGQGDITTYLRLGRAKPPMPTVWDSARTGEPGKAIASPDAVNAARHAKLDQIPFGVALGPPPGKADPNVVTAEVYRQVIEEARMVADLVVVDTQIIESHDTSGLIDGLVTPTLIDGGWAMVVSDLSSASVNNIHGRLGLWRKAGIPADRMLLVLNRVDSSVNLDMEQLGSSFGALATLVGAIEADADTVQSMNQGRIVSSSPVFARALDDILWRVTGDDVFDPSAHDVTGGGLLGRLLGRRK